MQNNKVAEEEKKKILQRTAHAMNILNLFLHDLCTMNVLKKHCYAFILIKHFLGKNRKIKFFKQKEEIINIIISQARMPNMLSLIFNFYLFLILSSLYLFYNTYYTEESGILVIPAFSKKFIIIGKI